MRRSNYVVILITAGSGSEGKKIAKELLNRREAACVNIVPKVHSLFRWEGKIDSSDEVLLIVKTKASLKEKVIRSVKRCHSYEVPEIIALPISSGNLQYLKWIEENTSS